MDFDGYGVTATLTGSTLTVTATSRIARGALGGSERVIPINEVSGIEVTKANLMRNGSIQIETPAGRTILHFLSKHAAGAAGLVEELRRLVPSAANDVSGAPQMNERAQDIQGRADGLEEWLSPEQVAEREIAASEIRHASQDAKAIVAAANIETKLEGARERASEKSSLIRGAAEEKAVRGEEKRQLTESAARDREARSTEKQVAKAAARQEKERSLPLDRAWDQALKADAEFNSRGRFNAQLVEYVDAAKSAAQSKDIILEEAKLAGLIQAAKTFGGKKEAAEAKALIASLERQKLLRIRSALLGTVKPESWLDQYNRKQAMSKIDGGSPAIIRSDRILHRGQTYVIDEFTSAQVYLDGVTQITQRPTLTRMALLSPLPGSAIIAGMAFQKKTTNDTRHAEFQVSAPGWSVSVPVNPNDLSGTRALAEQINRYAAMLERTTSTPVLVPAPRATGKAGQSKVEQLTSLQALIEAGALSEDEAKQLKAEILGSAQ